MNTQPSPQPRSHAHTLTIYTRQGCCLCKPVIALARRLQPEWGFELKILDVDDNLETRVAFGERIPVLLIDGQEVPGEQWTPADLRQAILHSQSTP
jgi:glutaredoxin